MSDIYLYIYYREILTNVIRALINNPFKESFYGKRKEKTIRVRLVTVFSPYFLFSKTIFYF